MVVFWAGLLFRLATAVALILNLWTCKRELSSVPGGNSSVARWDPYNLHGTTGVAGDCL
jgi:hypothetical protein